MAIVTNPGAGSSPSPGFPDSAGFNNSLGLPSSNSRDTRRFAVQPLDRQATQAVVEELQDQLESTRRRLVTVRVATLLPLAMTVALASLSAWTVCDYWWELGFGVRATGLALSMCGSLVLLIAAWRRWISTCDVERVAVTAENREPRFGQRLRTSLDYLSDDASPAPASPTLVAQMHADSLRAARSLVIEGQVDVLPFFGTLFSGGVVCLAALVTLLVSPEMRIAMGRMLLMPLEYTEVTFKPQEATVRQGESVLVEVEISGRGAVNPKVVLRELPVDGEAEVIGLGTDSKEKAEQRVRGKYEVKLERLQSDVEFQVVAGPRPLPTVLVRVLQPVTLEKFIAHLQPHTYTGQKPSTTDKRDFKVFEGSDVGLVFQLNRPVVAASLIEHDAAGAGRGPRPYSRASADEQAAGGANAKWAAKHGTPQNGTRESSLTESSRTENEAASRGRGVRVDIDGVTLTCRLTDLRTSGTFELQAKAEDGIELDPIRIQIRVQVDRPPSVKFIAPQEELEVSPTTEVAMSVEASDDLGLQKVGIVAQIGDRPSLVIWESDGEGSVEPLRGDAALMLEDHDVTFRDAVMYYAFAEDRYFGETRRTTTPLRFIDIRPFKRAFRQSDSEGEGGACSGSLTLEELIARQRHTLSLTFAAAHPQTKASPKLVNRLLISQTEIREATAEFAAGLADIGAPITELDAATGQMAFATDSLAKAELSEAVESQKQALAALISARQNLLKQLNQSSGSASQCRKFDRQQKQKLRQPEKPKHPDEQEKLAEARQQLNQLAQRQRKWSEEVRTTCNSSSSQSQSQPESQSASKPSESNLTDSKPNEPQQDRTKPGESKPGDSKPSDLKPGESKPGESGSRPTAEELAARQAELARKIAELQQKLAQMPVAKQAAQQLVSEAAEAAQEGLRRVGEAQWPGESSLATMPGEAAAEAGERAAERLEELADHLTAAGTSDFGQRLDYVEQLARHVAERQEKVQQRVQDGAAAPAQSKEEQRLAGRLDQLGELLDQLRAESATERGGIGETLERLNEVHAVSRLAAQLRQTADDLQAGRQAAAKQGAAAAAMELEQLARGLRDARAEYSQPQLQELVSLEEQLAQLLEQLQREKSTANGKTESGSEKSGSPSKPGEKSADSEKQGDSENKGVSDKKGSDGKQGQGAESGNSASQQAARKWEQISEKLEQIARGDKRLAEALRQLHQGGGERNSRTPMENQIVGPTDPHGGDNSERRMQEGFGSWKELGNFNGLRAVNQALQAKIQEAILAGALQDSDQPVPPQYRELVEKYYKTLSDDLGAGAK
jgi:hypothetical protein